MSFLENFKGLFTKAIYQNKDLNFADLLAQAAYLEKHEVLAIDIDQVKKWFATIYDQEYLYAFTDNEVATEIILHDFNTLQLDVRGKLIPAAISDLADNNDLQLSLESLALKNHIDWNFRIPYASFFTTIHGSYFRATLIHHSATPKKNSKLFLRRISKNNFKISDFTEDHQTIGLLADMVKNKKNIIISGSTASGKTSLMKALIDQIPDDEHIVVLEDTHEILHTNQHTTSFLADSDNDAKNLAEYCAYALRIRPERIILGEIRSREIVPLILAINNGHRGLLSSIHANSAKDTLNRLALLFTLYSPNTTMNFTAILKLICQNIEYVIYLEHKKVKEIIRVIGSEEANPIFEYNWRVV
jgi:type IV secretory pathway ATPase VirB11/archaellum biosynthesis ATPase